MHCIRFSLICTVLEWMYLPAVHSTTALYYNIYFFWRYWCKQSRYRLVYKMQVYGVFSWSSYPRRWMWQCAPTCYRVGRDEAATLERPHHVWGTGTASQMDSRQLWTDTGGCPDSPAERRTGGEGVGVNYSQIISGCSVTQEQVGGSVMDT